MLYSELATGLQDAFNALPHLPGLYELTTLGGGDAAFRRFGKACLVIQKAGNRLLCDLIGAASQIGCERSELSFLIEWESDFLPQK